MACLSPFYVDNPLFPYTSNVRLVPAPCGKCPDCLKRRADGWIFRLLQHDKVSHNAKFVTLTYDNDHVPRTKSNFKTLDKKAFSLFIRRIRDSYAYYAINPLTGRRKKYRDKTPDIKYYAVGEYGSKTERPHYHAIIFNIDENKIFENWKLGNVQIGTVTGDSVAYTCKYIHKGKTVPKHPKDDRLPEFSLMSKGLGKDYLTTRTLSFHRQDLSRSYVVYEGGYKKALPRYYRDKIWSLDERHKQSIIMQEVIEKNQQEKLQKFKIRTGNIDDYDRSVYESKKHLIQTFNKNEQNKRTKI